MSTKTKGKNIALRTAVDGILAAVALVLAFLESMLPDAAFLPPGAKLGLSNIAIMFAVLAVGIADGFVLVLIKSGFVLLTRGLSSLFMSLAGGLFSFFALAVIVIVFRKMNRQFSYTMISVICAVMHNTGQAVAASIYTQTNLLTSYLPLLIVLGILSGAVTGVILRTVMPHITRINYTKDKGLKE